MIASSSGESVSQEARVDEELDLHGEICPYTFVKSKLALEEMATGQILRVVVDNPSSAENVPRSLRNEGHEVLGVSQIAQREWAIIVKKAP
jgi:TusA-related sulfurtransferase